MNRSHAEGLAMLYLGKPEAPSSAAVTINTLGNAWVELDAGRKWVLGRTREYHCAASERWLEWPQSQLTRLGNSGELPERLRPFSALGLVAAKWELAREMDQPNAPELWSRLAAAVPSAVLTDAAADWTLWPGYRPSDRQALLPLAN